MKIEPVLDAPARQFFSGGKFPVKMQKIPCSEGILAGAAGLAAIRCISGVESSKINGLALIFFVLARVRARRATRGGDR